eukprot:evm.model.scf_104.9 EVM.evm.TU.scf_104.9   scf_104:112809-113517(+)
MVSGALCGAALGFAAQLYCNGVRKVPLLRNPWEHVMLTGLGAAFGSWAQGYTASLEKEVQELIDRRAALTRAPARREAGE